MLIIEGLCQFLDIIALIAVLGELKAVLSVDDLHISSVYGYGKLIYLVAGIVYIEFL